MTTDPQRYRNRVEEIEAIQWTGDNEAELSAFCSPFDFQTIDPEDRVEDPDETAAVRTHPHGGWLGLKPGDWVLKYADHFTATSDEAFRAVWEPMPAVPSAPVDRAAVLAEAATRYEEILAKANTGQDPRYWTAVRDITLGLRRMADEEQQPTTAEQAAAQGLTPAEYRAHCHRAAVEQVRAAAQGLYAGVGVRVLAALDETAPCGRLASLPGPCSAGDHCCAGPVQPAVEEQQPETETPDVVAAIVAALQGRAGELSELAEEQMRPSLEERAQEWHQAANVARRAAKNAAVAQPGKEAYGPRSVCVCGHTRAEHATVSGRLLCDACDGLSEDACKEFDAL